MCWHKNEFAELEDVEVSVSLARTPAFVSGADPMGESVPDTQQCYECDNDDDITIFGACFSIDTTTELDMSGDGWNMEIPSGVWQLTNLTYLNLSNNEFIGSIPPEIGNLTNLTELYLQNNQLSGSIPPENGNLTKL